MKRKLLYLSFVFVTFVFPVGEAGAVFLLIAPGAAAAATGEAQVAKANDAYASYYNPAGLGFQNKPGMAGMHVKWLPSLADDLYYEFLAYKAPTKFGTIGGHLIFLNLGEQMATDESQNELGKFRSHMWAFTASYGVKISTNSSIGINFKVFHQKLAESATASEGGKPYSTDFAFDLGYLKKFSSHKNPFNIGISISNIGPPIDFIDHEQADPSPTNFKMGIYKEFRINDYNKINFLVDINRLMVAKYPSMDRNADGLIDDSQEEMGYADPWYKAIVTCWFDDWYYKYDRDYDGDHQIGGYEQIFGEYKAFHQGFEYNSLINGDNGGFYTYSTSIWQNQIASIDFLDSEDPYEDDNEDGRWTPAEPFYDVGDGVYEELEDPLDLDDYEYMQNGNNYWIYYDVESGAIVKAQIEGDIGAYEVVSIDLGDGVYTPGEHDGLNEFVDWDGDGLRDEGEGYIDANGDGSYNTAYSPYNGSSEHQKEVGSSEDYGFSDELKELIANFGFEYWYTDNFVFRGGYIYDKEGNIMNPTFGAGIKFDKYGFDFGYTAGKKDHARANTMFFSISMDL